MKIAAYSLLICSTLSASIPTRDPIIKRINGGTNAEISEYPYIANFDIYNASGRVVDGCGASLITSRHVLTAAHCFHYSMAGVYNASDIVVNYANINFDFFTINEKNVKSYTKHPNFNWGGARINDIAIIELKEPVDTSVTSFAKIYDLPIVEGSVATVAGWGDLSMSYPGTLEKADIIISNSSECLARNDDWNGNNGDSGGPLSLLNLPGSPQMGVVSFGDSILRPIVCEDINSFNFYTNVFYLIDFITQTVGVPKELLLYSTEGTLEEKDLAIQKITGFKRDAEVQPEISSSSSSESSSESSTESSSVTSSESSSVTSSESSSVTSSESSSVTSSESSSVTSSESSGVTSTESSSVSSTESSSVSSTESSSVTSTESSSVTSLSPAVCNDDSVYKNFIITSSPNNKMYDLNNPIMLPCAGKNFVISFAVDSNTDTYIAFTDQQGYYSPGGITEILLGLQSGRYTSFSGKKFQAPSKRSGLEKRETNYVNIYLRDQTLSVYVDAELKFETKKNKNIISQLYLAPFKGRAGYSNIGARTL
ncbi:Prothrombin [Smittium culicis]|uniref:Prothrombin n=1 Tax=Smittium culicis TaxID=133412 RepID=A0A1R1X7S2_9FUNG|nr:Prothrombin [Smittium culicis]